jgi:outer membrane protein assembly factor BamB
VTSFSLSGGSTVWRQSLAPEGTRDREGYGGGLAADNGRIYAATGFGTVVAIEAKTGKRIWDKFLGAPIRTSPTAFGDRVVVTTIEGRVFALAGADGSELWNYRGVPQQASLIANPSPAIDGDVVVVPYASGELVALKLSNGDVIWSDTLTKTRGMMASGTFADAARPVIDGGTVFAVGYGGRTVAKQLRTGTTLWSLTVPGTQPAAVGGDTVFAVDTGGQLMAINRRDGKMVWTAKLPGATTWSGPTIAGDRLWLVSNKGTMLSVDPATGKVTGTSNLGNPSYIAPIVAQGRLFVLTDNARLMVFG